MNEAHDTASVFRVDPGVRRSRDGRRLIGGSPRSLFRLTEAGGALLDDPKHRIGQMRVGDADQPSAAGLVARESSAVEEQHRGTALGRDGKRAALIEMRDELGLAREATMAIGDGANDMDMIAEAGLGVAFRAKPKVAAAAPARIDNGDLTALLYVQGYRREEFVEN